MLVCSITRMDRIPYVTLRTLQFYRSVGVLQNRLHLVVSTDNEASLAWLERALDHALAHQKPELWAYLEAVIEEVLYEMELDTRL
jgi:hypothetical protein